MRHGMPFLKRLFGMPTREYALSFLVVAGLVVHAFVPGADVALFAVALVGALPTAWGALLSLRRAKINIDAFNTFAIVITFVTWDVRSAAFIVLMLSFARVLEWRTATRTSAAVKELLKLKPLHATVELEGTLRDIPADQVRVDDVLVVTHGARIPVDGVITYGEAYVNESSVTGESELIHKVVGDRVVSATLNESGTVKIRATAVGKDTTIERMAGLMREAAKNKSRTEKLADRFAGVFLPAIALLGLLTYLVTRNAGMTAALFLVACADDMAVAIPLAMTASIGQAAKRGSVVKGGEWFDALRRVRTVVFDKTGTLTYGAIAVQEVTVEPSVPEDLFWRCVGVAEKYSEHPIGRAVFREALKRLGEIPDPGAFQVVKGVGVIATTADGEVAVGNAKIFGTLKMDTSNPFRVSLSNGESVRGLTTFVVLLDKKPLGRVSVADVPRPEAKESIKALKNLGVERVLMFTGDNAAVARRVSDALGIDGFTASMQPEDKVRAIEMLLPQGPVAMVGDGINDAPALARADIGIAMGGSGTAVAVEAADVVILTDNLTRLPELVSLSRRTVSIVHGDVAIWLISNAFGFLLVFTGFLGPALAAFYNFVTDFFPLLNSSRLFNGRGRETKT